MMNSTIQMTFRCSSDHAGLLESLQALLEESPYRSDLQRLPEALNLIRHRVRSLWFQPQPPPGGLLALAVWSETEQKFMDRFSRLRPLSAVRGCEPAGEETVCLDVTPSHCSLLAVLWAVIEDQEMGLSQASLYLELPTVLRFLCELTAILWKDGAGRDEFSHLWDDGQMDFVARFVSLRRLFHRPDALPPPGEASLRDLLFQCPN